MAGIRGISRLLKATPENYRAHLSIPYNCSKQPMIVYSVFIICKRNGRFRLVTLAFAGSIGMTFVILACALPKYGLWWPFFVVLFYVLTPIPTMIARRTSDGSGNQSFLHTAIFLTMGFVISSFALPIVLARAPVTAPVIQWGACYLTLAGNVVVYATMIGFFLTFDQEDSDYNMW